MADPFLAELRIFSFNFAPRGWAMANGQTMQINQNQALFSLLGTTYGGNGQTTFLLPNLQGRVPMYGGQGLILGQNGGELAHTITTAEMPAHTHPAIASSNGPTVKPPTDAFWASNTGFAPYGATADTSMSPQSLSNAGGSQPHDNVIPYLTINFIISLFGIFPSQT